MKVFVYGTLKVGGYFAGQLDDYRLSSEETSITGFSMYNLGNFPTVVRDDSGRVHGEVHDYKQGALAVLDRIEGYREENPDSSLYVRETISVDGEDVFIYIINCEEKEINKQFSRAHKIDSGKW